MVTKPNRRSHSGQDEPESLADLSRQVEEITRECERLQDENHALKRKLEGQREGDASKTGARPTETRPVDAARVEQILDIILPSFLRMVASRLEFRKEFVGQTILQLHDSLPLYSGPTSKTKDWLLEPGVSAKEFDRRLNMLRKAVEEVVFHVVGLIEGYRSGVTDGTRGILGRIDPGKLRKEIRESSLRIGPIEISYRYLPFFFDRKLIQLYERAILELKEEDRGIIEKRDFRPGFIRGYEALTLLTLVASQRERESSTESQENSNRTGT
jgi:hypothetical protein